MSRGRAPAKQRTIFEEAAIRIAAGLAANSFEYAHNDLAREAVELANQLCEELDDPENWPGGWKPV